MRVLLTQRCNLKCLYCHKEGQYSERQEIKPDEFKGLVEIATEFGLDEVKYSGGEPLLYNHLGELINHTKDIGVKRVSVTTNGLLLEQKLDELRKSRLDELSVSLDTLNAKVFRQLNRGKEKDLEVILSGIRKASGEKMFAYTNINMSLTKYNLQEIEQMMNFARELGVQLRLISFIPLGKKHRDDLSISAKSVFEKLKEEATEIKRDKSLPAYTTLKMSDGLEVMIVDSSCFNCHLCGKSYALRLTTDGKLKPCLLTEKPEIDVITPYKKKDLERVRFRFAQAIAIKKFGLMELIEVPLKRFSEEYLVEEP